MGLKSALVSLSLLAIAQLATAAPAATLEKSKRDYCNGAQKRVFALPGSGTSWGSLGNFERMGELVSGIDSSISVERVSWPCAPWLGYTTSAYTSSVRDGITALSNTIAAAVQECPSVNIVVWGYSQGAQVTSNSLAGIYDPMYNGRAHNAPQPPAQSLNLAYADNIKGIELFGDPTHQWSQDFVTGEQSSGPAARSSNINWSPFDGRVHSWCASGDEICSEDQGQYGPGQGHQSYWAGDNDLYMLGAYATINWLNGA